MVIRLLILGRLLRIYGKARDLSSVVSATNLSLLHADVFPYRDDNLKTTQIRPAFFRRSASLAASLIVPIPSGLGSNGQCNAVLDRRHDHRVVSTVSSASAPDCPWAT